MMPSPDVTHAEVAAPVLVQPGDLTARRPSLNALTGIRFFAAFYVVLFHSRLPELLDAHHGHFAAQFIENGSLAVVLFFLLSGMILSYTYQGQIEDRRGLRRFYEARFARVWPLYMASLLLSSLFNHTTPGPLAALATLCMVQAWNPIDTTMAGAWNFVCWTLSTEALFYVLFPFAQRWLERRSTYQQTAVLAGLLVLSVGLRTSLHGFATGLQWLHVPLALIHVPEFLIGVCLGNLFNRQRATGSTRLFAPGLWTLTATLATIACLSASSPWVNDCCVACFAALLYGLAAEPSPVRSLLSLPLLLVGGQISYGVYLLQWPLKSAASLLSHALHLPGNAEFAVYLAVLSAVSCVSFHAVEEPGRKLLRAAFARLERARGNALELRRT